ncbi:PTS sugar transporter subunit IIA [Scopulibacillus cellulosilyticus]|uniref:PTS sugar transporter subunit IIA n=1 Tax=Scopulibacillus cellulosilyticus TaxID=2665665 RepID=A0ABW2Q134_9BACL
MRYFLFASHGRFADGILDSVELIMGKQNNIRTINAYTKENKDIKSEITKIIESISAEDELIVVTDIFGGSVNNEFMNLLNDRRIYLIAGLNLPLVIELISLSRVNSDTDQMIKTALRNAKNSIQYCNYQLSQAGKDEDF